MAKTEWVRIGRDELGLPDEHGEIIRVVRRHQDTALWTYGERLFMSREHAQVAAEQAQKAATEREAQQGGAKP